LHHSDAGWSGPTRFREMLDVDDALACLATPFIPDFSFVLDDLHRLDDVALRTRAVTELVKLTQLVLQRCRGSSQPVAVLSPWLDTFVVVLTSARGGEALTALIRYTLEVTEGRSEELRNFFRQLGPAAQEAFMTAADELTAQARARALAQGLEQGLEQGRNEGQATLLLRLLGRRFGPPQPQVRERVLHASPAELESWADRLMQATEIAEVFEPGEEPAK
jgi:hypothetical protein